MKAGWGTPGEISLCECVDAYGPVDEAQRQELQTALLTDPDPGVRTMTMTMFERMRQEGRQEGLVEGQRQLVQLVQSQLEKRFGALSEPVRQRLSSCTAERLTELGVALLTAPSLRDLGLEE